MDYFKCRECGENVILKEKFCLNCGVENPVREVYERKINKKSIFKKYIDFCNRHFFLGFISTMFLLQFFGSIFFGGIMKIVQCFL